MGKEQNNSAWALPFRFCAGNELVDHDLRTVHKIAELRLPLAEHVREVERVAVVEAEHAGFAQQGIVNADLRLLAGLDVIERAPTLARVDVVKIRMTLAE